MNANLTELIEELYNNMSMNFEEFDFVCRKCWLEGWKTGMDDVLKRIGSDNAISTSDETR